MRDIGIAIRFAIMVDRVMPDERVRAQTRMSPIPVLDALLEGLIASFMVVIADAIYEVDLLVHAPIVVSEGRGSVGVGD